MSNRLIHCPSKKSDLRSNRARVTATKPSMVEFLQACLVGSVISASITQLLDHADLVGCGSPYDYNSLLIGCFALGGLGAMTLCPRYSKVVSDRLKTLFSNILGEFVRLVGVMIRTYFGHLHHRRTYHASLSSN